MKTATLIVIVSVSTWTCTLAQGKLQKAKDNISKSSSASTYESSDSYDNHDQEGGSGFLSGFVLEVFYVATYGALIGEIQPRSINPYPYAEGGLGEYKPVAIGDKGKQSKLMISNTLTFRSNMYGNDLKVNYRFIPVLGIEGNHLHFFENNGEKTELGLSSIMLNYYRIRENSVTGFWGIGATHAGNGVNATGFSYNLGLDIYVAPPISLGLYWKQTFINENSINEFRALTRYHKKKVAIQGGYIHYKIGGVNFPSAAAGIEFRL